MYMKKFVLLFAPLLLAASPANAEVDWWAVPAMSSVQRLPDAIPEDGVKGGEVRLIAARGEYEPASFVLRSDKDLGKVQLTVGKLVNEKGEVFPADALDLRIVKVWYQNGNGWFSYFADTGFKLCPELILHDEDLIRVDCEKEANYARITGKDGRKSEWWLNPPRLLNGRYYDHTVETWAFPSMRPGFADAKTLQPVSLDKDVSKQFILTAHVAPGTPAGIYRGFITGGGLSIPVAVKVLDFDLPRPMAYFHPEMDFRICSYDYIGSNEILKLNGGDEDLMWTQLEAILADMAAHGQDMKWIRTNTATAESERTIALMKKVGMRTDTFLGGVDFVWNERDYQTSYERAERISAYYDRTYGHHNIYGGYGDEPGPKFFPANRSIFDAYQAAGLKFIIASREHIIDLAGYRWNWHNASKNPTDPSVPSIWNELGSNTYVAWYADQHVGAENPEFNRRQYGLAPYLSGYSALCNYAHHLGPYNDDSETYKPMMFFYGSADGVLDTIQWEGFREGVDDIRYATLLMALCREADKSDDIQLRYLAGKARVMLARFDHKTGDLDAARVEMIGFIESLREALGDKADVKIEAVIKTAPRSRDAYVDSEQLPTDPKLQAEYYAKRYMIDEQVECLQNNGFKTDAAVVLIGRSGEKTRQALALAEEDIRESVAAKDSGRFSKSWNFLLEHRPETADRYFKDAIRLLGAASVADNLLERASGRKVAYNGNWQLARHFYERALKADGADADRLWNLKTVQYAIPAFLETGDVKRIIQFCDLGLATAAKGDTGCVYKQEDVYQLQLAKAICGAKSAEAVTKKLSVADRQFGDGVSPENRKARIERLGSFAMNADREDIVRGVASFLDQVYAPKPCKTYTVRFSPTRILGAGNWEAAAAVAKPGTEVLDRSYGGDASCLWTDVATQRGTVNADTDKSYARLPEWQAMADGWGFHFRLEVFDEQAREIGLGLASAGSLEAHLAPGENTPYYALIHPFKTGELFPYNPAYSHPGYNEISATDRANCREEVVTTDNSVILYMGISWQTFATRVPTAGSVWDFEPMFWGRKANCSWNGLKTIHGRSSWGHLRFELTDADRRSILHPLLIAAGKAYRDEQNGKGMVSLWQNEEVGDPAFYESVLKPVIEQLDASVARIGADMDDAAIDELAATTLPRLHDFRFEIQRLRAAYLQDRYTR